MIKGNYTDDDLAAYKDILRQTNILRKDFNPNSSYPRSSESWNWRSIPSPIWEKWRKESDDETHGNGLIVKNGRIWKRKSGKGFKKWRNGIYSKKGHLIYKL